MDCSCIEGLLYLFVIRDHEIIINYFFIYMSKIFIIIGIVIALVAGVFILLQTNTQQPAESTSPMATPSASPTVVGGLMVPPGGVALPPPVRASAPAKNQGTVVFALKDSAESLDNFQYILLQLKGVSVHSHGGAWIQMKNTPPLFDLLKLYRSAKESAFLTELNLDVGTYDQVRLDVGAITLVTKDGIYHAAKVPSSMLQFNSQLIVEKAGKSSVTVEILSDKSIHSTGNGIYIFAPVIKFETRSKLSNIQVFPTGEVSLIGGKTDTSIDAGMDENGDLKKDFSFDPSTNFEIIGNVIHVIPKGESQAEIKIMPQEAIDIAIRGGYVTSVLSIKTTHRMNKTVWQITGIKADGMVGMIYIDVVSGLVVGS